MQISDLQSIISNTATLAQQASSSTSTTGTGSFQSVLSSTLDDSGESSLEEFMEYASETPGQRLFSTWLGGQNLSLKDFNAMSDSEKEKIVEKFKEYLKQHISENINSTLKSGVGDLI